MFPLKESWSNIFNILATKEYRSATVDWYPVSSQSVEKVSFCSINSPLFSCPPAPENFSEIIARKTKSNQDAPELKSIFIICCETTCVAWWLHLLQHWPFSLSNVTFHAVCCMLASFVACTGGQHWLWKDGWSGETARVLLPTHPGQCFFYSK